MSLDIQVKSMLAMILAGFYVGVAYETFRYFLPMWQKRIILNYLLVILFWMLQTVIVFYLLYIINMGELRFYLFIAFLLGVSIYQGIFAPLYQRLLQRIITSLKRILLFCWRVFFNLLIKPFCWLVKGLWEIVMFFVRLVCTPILFMLRPVGSTLKTLVKVTQKRLPKPILTILYKNDKIYDIIKNTLIRIIDYITFKRR